EILRDVKPMTSFSIPDDAVVQTKALIDKAMSKKTYSIDNIEPFCEISKINNRLEIRAEKWALCFAILLGRDSIDDDCAERGIALSIYENAVKNYLNVGEAFSQEAALQRELRLVLERA